MDLNRVSADLMISRKTKQVPETATSVQKPASEGDRNANRVSGRTDMRIAFSCTCHDDREERTRTERTGWTLM